ncbi:chemotaxis protein CheW [Marinibactrum halimedae]|uniref:Chemotaxis protein n=1 Tax=Marinibactrum halimedae TaxID=1444977 RepID=A0AA37TBH9_9GAMM|nr:chemotaxis protein CheW [Marinibactrum halimedae]MCD9458332.1 chemotaxis protein CheW [Marinibactrum halimedae]GLS27040.1 chemotaxis protein [Marinibactrum halimedae]
MNNPELLEFQSVEVLPSLLLPIAEGNLVVPNVTVAEMVPWSDPIEAQGPDWLLGYFPWRNIELPLLSFEAINGGENPGRHPRSRIAVLNCTGVSSDLAFIALLTQGIPRIARVEREQIAEGDVTPKPFELMHVRIAAEDAIIPNVAALEEAVLNLPG